jgi:hypothetical protein
LGSRQRDGRGKKKNSGDPAKHENLLSCRHPSPQAPCHPNIAKVLISLMQPVHRARLYVPRGENRAGMARAAVLLPKQIS